MSHGFRPNYDRVLVQLVGGDIETKGGIVLPDAVQGGSLRAKVIAVGPRMRGDGGIRDEPRFAVGDAVILGAYAGHDVRIDGEAYRIVSDADILGVLEA